MGQLTKIGIFLIVTLNNACGDRLTIFIPGRFGSRPQEALKPPVGRFFLCYFLFVIPLLI